MLAAVLMMATGVSAAKKPALVGTANRYYFSAKNQKEYNKQPLYDIQKGNKIELLADQGDGESVLTITYRNKKTKEKAKWEVYCYLEEEEDW